MTSLSPWPKTICTPTTVGAEEERVYAYCPPRECAVETAVPRRDDEEDDPEREMRIFRCMTDGHGMIMMS